MELNYSFPIYRPPSERQSLLVQVTEGCKRNCCTFCFGSISSRFNVRSFEEIEADLYQMRSVLNCEVRKAFFLAADPLIVPTDHLIKICTTLKKIFPENEQIAMYAHGNTILSKTPAELSRLREAGVSLLYVGIESGSDKVLQRVRKGIKSQDAIDACKKAMHAGINISTTIIFGLGGREFSLEHARDTAYVISEIMPKYVGALSLIVKEGTALHHEMLSGEFEPLSPIEMIEEMLEFVKSVNVIGGSCLFRANHPSNYFSIGADLALNKDQLLLKLNSFLRESLAKEQGHSNLLRAL